MISTRIIPVATATSQELLVEITESTCRQFCVNSVSQPSASVAFSVSSVRELNGNAIATINAVVTVFTPNQNPCGCAKTQLFTESFDIAFEATATNNVTLAAGDEVITVPAMVKCCRAGGVRLTTTLTATIA